MTRQLDPDQLPGTPGGNRLICAECTIDEDPAPWCDCRDGEQCRGPCRKRAHGPERCPFLQAYVPLPIRWSQVKPGDTIRWRNGELHMVEWVSQEAGHEAPPGRWMIQTRSGIYAGQQFFTADPNHPVPVLVPYAERAALLTLRAGGTGPTILERP